MGGGAICAVLQHRKEATETRARNKQVRLSVKVASASATKQIDMDLFNAEDCHLSGAKMPDRTGLWGVLRVLDESLQRFSDDERLPRGLPFLAGGVTHLRIDAAVGTQQPAAGTSFIRCAVVQVVIGVTVQSIVALTSPNPPLFPFPLFPAHHKRLTCPPPPLPSF